MPGSSRFSAKFLRISGIFGVSLGLHAAAFASVALFSTAPLQALDLKQHSVEVELSFVEAEGQGERTVPAAPSVRPPTPTVSPVVTALVDPPASSAKQTPDLPSSAVTADPTAASDSNESQQAGGGAGSGGMAPQSLQTLAKAWLQSVGRLIFANAVRHYPAPARQAHLEGTVALAITIDAVGRITDVAIKRSSGHAELDTAALAAVHAIHKVPAPPALLNWRPRALTLPIVYKLN